MLQSATTAQLIGKLMFGDGTIHQVFRDATGQYIFNKMGQREYGDWILTADLLKAHDVSAIEAAPMRLATATT